MIRTKDYLKPLSVKLLKKPKKKGIKNITKYCLKQSEQQDNYITAISVKNLDTIAKNCGKLSILSLARLTISMIL